MSWPDVISITMSCTAIGINIVTLFVIFYR